MKLLEMKIFNIKLPVLFVILSFFLNASAAYAQSPSVKSTEQPPWQACNETSFILEIAIASVPQDSAGSDLEVQGWNTIRPGKCKIMEVKKGTQRYIYARSAGLHQGGIREWKGSHPFCVAAVDFKTSTDLSCDLQNLHTAQFLKIIPTEERTAFVEPANFGKKAEMAGLQRLLKDNNYSIKSIDGVGGRKTSKTLRTFLKANQIKPNLSMADKFTALEKSAQELSNTVGITLCNESSARVWSAIAYFAKNNWHSRGWWPIEIGQCARPLTQNLTNMQAHIYARQETEASKDLILKMPTNKTKLRQKEFCISEASFSAINHKNCFEQGYVSARFKAIKNSSPEDKITLTDIDFGTAPISGLR